MTRKATKCFVPWCENKRDDPCLSFFTIPNDRARAEKWVNILNLPKLKMTAFSQVCQNHFSRSQFLNLQRNRLIKYAIPHADRQPYKDLTTQITRTLRSSASVPYLISSTSRRNVADNTDNAADVQMKTLSINLTRLKLPISPKDKQMTSTEPHHSSSAMLRSMKLCLLCPNPTVTAVGQNNERHKEKWTNLVLLLCRILNLQFKSFSGIPFCKLCENRIEEFEKVYMKLKVLELRVEKEIEKLKRDFVSIYLQRRTNVSVVGRANTAVLDALLAKWRSENCSKNTKPYLESPQPENNMTNSVREIIVLPVGFSLQNLNPGIAPLSSSITSNPAVPLSSSAALNPGTPLSSSAALNPGTPFTSSITTKPRVPPMSSLAIAKNIVVPSNSSVAINPASSSVHNIEVLVWDNLEELSVKSEPPEGGDDLREISDEEFEDNNSNEASTAKPTCDDVVDNSQGKPNKRRYARKVRPPYVRKVRLLQCPICPAILRNSLKQHLARHTAEKRFECYDCDAKFSLQQNLSHHRRLVHGYNSYNLAYDKSRFYECNFCQKEGMLKHEFLRHIRSVHLEKEATANESFWFYECDFEGCKNCFSNQTTLKEHMLREHKPVEISECEVCTRIFCVKENMEIHQTGHSVEPQKFPCNYCCRVFDSEIELNKHLSRHQILFQLSQFIICERCGKMFLNQVVYKLHKKKSCKLIPESEKKLSRNLQRTEGKEKCKVCGKEYTRTHMIQHNYVHTHPEGFKCSHCSHVSTTPNMLYLHNMRCHLNRPAKSKRLSEIKLRWYKCECVIDPFQSQSRFLRHIKNVHLNKNIVDGTSFWFYYCDFEDCSVSCPSWNELKDHAVKSHELELSELYECGICARFFCMKENLDMHKKCHSDDETVFSCNYCSAIFNSVADVERHTQDHEVIFQLSQFVHTCELCGEGFLEMAGLYGHRSNNKKNGRDCRNLKHNITTTKTKKETLKNQAPEKIKKPRKRKPNKNPTVNRKYPCSVCGIQLMNANLRQHMYKHTHPEGFKCAFCDHISRNPLLLKIHGIRVHPNHPGSQSIHTCEYCQKMWPSPLDLKMHKIRHHPQEFLQGRIPCIVCHSIFDSEELMDVHFQDRHQDKICLVEGCDRKFANTFSVARHRRTHTGEKPFVCSYCNASFGDETTCQYHVNTRHTFHRSFLCKLCPDNPGFYERRTFYKHVSTEHPEKNPADILQHNYLKRKFVANYHLDYRTNRRTY